MQFLPERRAPQRGGKTPKKLPEGDTASRFLEKQPPGRAGDCFASLAMTVSAREKSGLAMWSYSQQLCYLSRVKTDFG
jgi:hypothetical protein